MEIRFFSSSNELGEKAASLAAQTIKEVIQGKQEARMIVATGASQFELLSNLVKHSDIPWDKVTAFHLDEYIGLSATHPASFRKYLRERFFDLVPLGNYYEINGDSIDPYKECERLGKILNQAPIDLALIGIGENGHIAFNDPPADFSTEEPYCVVKLDKACRLQQVGEGWFTDLDQVPKQAISMSVRQILKAGRIICTVPDTRKSQAVKATVEGPVTPEVPASILQTHPDCWLLLDRYSAVLLGNELR
jgi:glucosamine-6-phosphate deaminase